MLFATGVSTIVAQSIFYPVKSICYILRDHKTFRFVEKLKLNFIVKPKLPLSYTQKAKPDRGCEIGVGSRLVALVFRKII